MAYPLNNYYPHMLNLLQMVIFSIKIVIEKLGTCIWCNMLLLICQQLAFPKDKDFNL